MRFTYHPTMCPPDQYEPLAKAAEELGFHSFTYPDSIAYPKEGSDVYPYNDDGTRDFLEDVPFIEPFIGIPYLAAKTEKIRFTTSVYKLAVRQPLVVAKQLSSLAIVTNNRFAFGVGISPWPEDFEMTQIPWEKRGLRLSEMIQVINGLMSGEFFEFKGEIFDIKAVKICPAPSERPPILVGGHAPPALKRAAQYGDGWIAAGASIEEYKSMIDQIHEHRKSFGRDHLPFEIQVMSKDTFTMEGLEALAGIGVDEVVIGFRDSYKSKVDDKSVEEKIGMMQWYADNFISKFA